MNHNINFIFLLIIFTTIKKTTQIKTATVSYLKENSLSDPTSNKLLFYLDISSYSKNQPIFIKIKDSNSFSSLKFKYCLSEALTYDNLDESNFIEKKEESKKENVYKIKITKTSLIYNYLEFLIISENNFEKEVTFINDEAINNLRPGEIVAIVIACMIIITFFILMIYCCCCKPYQAIKKRAVQSNYANAMYYNEIQKRNDPYIQAQMYNQNIQAQMYYNQNMQGQMYYNQNMQPQMYYNQNMQGQMNYNQNIQGNNGAFIYSNYNVGNSNVNLKENHEGVNSEKELIKQNK